MPSQKRIQHLRSKNKLLLDKLESHSSKIESQLKYLKRTLRGATDKSPSCNDTRLRNWSTRNNSLQVTGALSSCSIAASGSTPKKYTLKSRGKSREFTNGETEKFKGNENKEPDVVYQSPVKEQRPSCTRLKSKRRTNGVNSPCRNSKTIHEILTSMDYSPKSIFVKRMKSKCKSYMREVYWRSPEEKSGTTTHEKESARTKLDGSQVSSENPSCYQCGKTIKKQSASSTCEDGSSKSEEPKTCSRLSKENAALERVKNFREHNREDCHADPSKNDHSCHCCEHHKCCKEYEINDRLFAVSLGHRCENMVQCPSSSHSKCQHACCDNVKQVIVTIPTSLLESSPLNTDNRKKLKGAKEGIPVSKGLQKMLQRPVPQNSMALRFQKGVC